MAVSLAVVRAALAEMLSINVPLTLVTMSTLPFVYILGGRMRRRTCSRCRGSIQARLADVATVVDENINGVRVVKSFAAEEPPARASSPRAAQAVAVGQRQGRRHPRASRAR